MANSKGWPSSARCSTSSFIPVARALAAGDMAAAKEAVDGMWSTMLETYQAVQELGVAWNAVAATVAQP